jgi:phospholipid/cholesterol/gamma-HCH transport system permease protein
MCPQPVNPLTRVLVDIGAGTAAGARTMIGLVGFLGAIVIAIYNILSTPARFRWHAMVQGFDNVAVKALGIIGLMSFMIGLVIAEQGSTQLAANGLEIYTINLIGRLSLRDLGILMTAIMVAGRSGSAFAAQIGTMKLTEEIDAMRTIGISPIEALVLPRVIACTLMMPLLGFYSAFLAIVAGGLFCWGSLHIPPVTFIERLREVVPTTDLWVGLIKGPVFGLIVAMTGCFQGMLVESDAEQVGLKTTAAVVQAIFLVIVLDAFFDVFFTQIGWG